VGDLDFYTDQQLLRLVADGDEEAFTLLYRRYWEVLFVRAVKVIGSREDAADIVQEVFLSIWHRRAELVITGSLGAYLQTSVRYQAIHYIEKNITRRNYLEQLTELANRSDLSPEALLQAKEVQQVVHDTVRDMPPRMREVWRLSRQENLSHAEIATRLGISEETVKKHIQHALQLIKTSIGRSSVSLTALLLCLFS
jgi:RNA polymerase sigma-70 factor (family 1)